MALYGLYGFEAVTCRRKSASNKLHGDHILKATGREKRTESQAIGTKMLRWDIYQDFLAHITTGRSEGE